MADERFTALSTDPRYRLPSRKQAQTAVDSRFKRLFTDEGFQKKASVDRYGRKVKSDLGKKGVERRFRLDDDKVKAAEESDVDTDTSQDDLTVNDPARVGFSGTSSEEESTSEEESGSEDDIAEDTAGYEQTEEVPMGEVTKRIAVVNLDWDNVRASDIMAVANSFVPSGGKIVNTVVYPSEFGQERMQREELEGPPKEIFSTTTKQDSDEDDSDEDERIRKQLLREQARDGEEFDNAKLRQYQLERLRYYYAVISCDDESTAKALYDNMDGREYLTTANFFDLRFIPADTTFDDEPRDECSKLEENYKPNEFRTDALTHSNVRLTWDNDDATRKEVQKRAFSRAEIDEDDMRAYIGSDSDADSMTSRKSAMLSKRDTAKAKMRAALGLPDEPTKAKKQDDEPVGDMQITFTAGLSTKEKGQVFENEPQDEESTKARYVRKERERRQKRKEKAKAIKGGEEEPADEVVDEEDPFNDPFFNDPETAAVQEKKARRADKDKKKEVKKAEKQAAASRRAELELLMAEDDGNAVQHFDMKEIEKAEKLSKKKGKKAKEQAKELVKDDFQVETEDPRFKQLFESHEYAIDPTNPKFRGTQGMKALLEQGRRKRKNLDEEPERQQKKTKQVEVKRSRDPELNGLVARLKTKSARS